MKNGDSRHFSALYLFIGSRVNIPARSFKASGGMNVLKDDSRVRG